MRKETELRGVARCLWIGALVLVTTAQIRAAATAWQIAVLSNQCNGSVAYAISSGGEVVGTHDPCDNETFALRTTSSGYTESFQAELHNALRIGSETTVTASEASDIQSSLSGVAIVGQMVYKGTNLPYWYLNTGSDSNAIPLKVHSNYTSADAGAALGLAQTTNTFVAGWLRSNGTTYACVWSVVYRTNSNILISGLEEFPGTESVANATDGNRTVGYYVSSGSRKAFLIDDGGSASYELPLHGSASASEAFGIYTSGSTSYIVGYYVSNSVERPILWTFTSSINVSYTHLAIPNGKSGGVARDINDAFLIVGYVSSGEQACVWNSNGTLNVILDDLGISGWLFQRAYGISPSSNGSKIVGAGSVTSLFRGFICLDWQSEQ